MSDAFWINFFVAVCACINVIGQLLLAYMHWCMRADLRITRLQIDDISREQIREAHERSRNGNGNGH